MTAAAHIPGITNPTTGENRLFDLVRWLVTILLVHFIIARGRRLAAALHQPYGPDDAFLAHHFGTTDRDRILARLTRALSRAAALEDDLLARRPIEQGFSIETRRAINEQIADICRDLGIFRVAPTRALNLVQRRYFPLTIRQPATADSPVAFPQPTATGPPKEYTSPAQHAGEVGVRSTPGEGATVITARLRRGCTPGASPGAHPRLFHCTHFLNAFSAPPRLCAET